MGSRGHITDKHEKEQEFNVTKRFGHGKSKSHQLKQLM